MKAYKTTVPVASCNGRFNKEKTLAELKRCGAERIDLSLERELDYTFSSPENLALLSELIEYFQKNGIESTVRFCETIGHSKIEKAKDMYTNIRYIGRGDQNIFCPMDEKFVADVANWVKNTAKCGAKTIILDDDFRINYRGAGYGCCCDLHMSALRAELGENIEEHELKEKLFSGGKNKYRDAWIKIQGGSLYNFAEVLRQALDEINPEVRLGYCCSPNVFDTDGTDALKMARILAGKTKPLMRLIGAPYWVPVWQNQLLGEVIEHERNQLSWCKNSGIEVITEGDTYPRPRFATPASFLECFDMILRADGQSDGIMKHMLDFISDADYETGYVDAMVKNKSLYEEIDKAFSGKTCAGLRPYNIMHLMENAEYDSSRENILNELQNSIFYPSYKFALLNSLPITYENGFINILFGENARYISDEELNNGNIIDLTAAKILMSRGIDVGIKKLHPKQRSAPQSFFEVPSEYFFGEEIYTRLSEDVSVPEIEHCAKAEILSEIRYGKTAVPGVYTFENDGGQRFFVLPFDGEQAKNALGWFNSYARRRQIIKSLEWLGKSPFTVFPDGNYPHLYIMAKKNGSSLSVGLWNLFADAVDSAKIRVNVPFDEIRFINCDGRREGNNVVLSTTLYPYEFAGFEISQA